MIKFFTTITAFFILFLNLTLTSIFFPTLFLIIPAALNFVNFTINFTKILNLFMKLAVFLPTQVFFVPRF